MSWFKPKRGNRRASPSKGGLRGAKPIPSRGAPGIPAHGVQKRSFVNIENSAAQRVIRARKWDLRQGLAYGMDACFLGAVWLFIVLKNGGEFLLDLLLSGWELISRRFYPIETEFKMLDVETSCGRPDFDIFAKEDPVIPTRLEEDHLWDEEPIPEREVVERAKISILATEEEDLPEALLEDQAGALRSRLAAVTHEGGD